MILIYASICAYLHDYVSVSPPPLEGKEGTTIKHYYQNIIKSLISVNLKRIKANKLI